MNKLTEYEIEACMYRCELETELLKKSKYKDLVNYSYDKLKDLLEEAEK